MYCGIKYYVNHRENDLIGFEIDIDYEQYFGAEAVKYGVKDGKKLWYLDFNFGILGIGTMNLFFISIGPFSNYKPRLELFFIQIL